MINIEWLTPTNIILLIIMALGPHFFSILYWLKERRAAGGLDKIYNLPHKKGQLKRELVNSLIMPVHAVILFIFVAIYALLPAQESIFSVLITFIVIFIWAEIWHYTSHRLMHTKQFLFIHREHHLSMVNTPFTALSFSLLEKVIFSVGIVGVMAALSHALPVSLIGIVGYYTLYAYSNAVGHSNIEIRSPSYTQSFWGKWLNTPTYHAMHHARYINNYGLMTQCLDRLFNTQWEDYPQVHRKVANGESLLTYKERVQ